MTSAKPQKQRSLGGWLLAAPMMVYVIAFFVVPLIVLIVFSFSQFDMLTLSTKMSFTLENYAAVFSPTYVGAIIRSFVLTLIMIVLCLLLGYPVALRITQASPRVKAALLVSVIVPYWISFIVRVYAWLDLLSPGSFLSKSAAFFGIVPGGSQLAYSDFAILVGMVAGYLPLMILPLFMTLDRMDKSFVEAASDMGLTRFKAFWKVVVPLSAPGAIAGILLVGIPATGEYTIPVILGGGQTLMAGNLQADAFLSTGNYPFGSAIATVLLVVMMAILAMYRKRLDQLGSVV